MDGTCLYLFFVIIVLCFLEINCVLNSTTDINAPTIGGPNVCRSRYRNYCCPGWSLKQGTGLCVIPVCWRHCGDGGRCIKPNICLCDGGSVGATCYTKTPANQTSVSRPEGDSTCPFTCLNGGTCVGTKCVCKTGYVGDYCSEPVCKEGCTNSGRCIAPDQCACLYGYAGKRCETDYRTGPCYRKVVNDMCQSQLEDVVCTKQLCCATVGRAWGHPCEHCPLQLSCEEGYLKNMHSGQCIDIDECEAIPGLCGGGTCINTLGSFQCICPEGKKRNVLTNTCEDEDECANVKQYCEHGRCINTDGSYYCICDTGYVPTRDLKHCLDTKQGNCFTELTGNNECTGRLTTRLSKTDCCCGHNMGKGWGESCELCPSVGNDEFIALCLGGHTGGSMVVSVNECMLRPDICGGGHCVDTLDGYLCQCFPGYKKNGVSQVCEDENECSRGLCSGGTCVNTPGSYSCVCPVGFDVSSDGKQCIDHDECHENGMCANGVCINMDGSFKCKCKTGFTVSPTGHACMDVDECTENSRICLNGRCINTAGSYRCECLPGFISTSDGAFCVDVNECVLDVICDNGRCINTDGSFKCVCNSGYRLSSDKKTCEDFDECQNNVCSNGKCVNTIGSFKCECPHGFYLSSDGRSCIDSTRDLCYSNYENGQCTNPSLVAVSKSSCCCTVGTGKPIAWGTPCLPCPLYNTQEFNNICPHGPGLTFTGVDINECAQNPAVCQNGACENLMGGYRCICNTGYEVDNTGKICTDVDECLKEDICNRGQCRNTLGSFQCICPTGTQFNTKLNICEDIDECTEILDACTNGRCVNTVGSYQCDCPPGSVIDNTGRICLDNRRGTCWTKVTKNGNCENNLPKLTLKTECCCSIGLAWGSPCELCHNQDCPCAKGYAKTDGKGCTDVNECELDSRLCRGGGSCINTEGSFTCVCPPGLILDSTGTVCQDIRLDICYGEYRHGTGVDPIQGLYPKNMCCCSSIGRAWGDASSASRCEPCPRSGSPIYTDLCPKGPGFVDRKDINECSEFPGICKDGKCKNTMGGFICQCNPGFSLDDRGIKCIDIDECGITDDVCGGNGECVNTPGSFNCKCKEGYQSHPVMKICMDVNECEAERGLCRDGQCINIEGSYQCLCPPGHELAPDKKSCKDIDECSRTSGICSNGVCENEMGTYQCVCDNGYRQVDLKSHCEDVNECDFENGNCEEGCINTPGSYYCECRNGRILLPNGRNCADVDECADNPRICNGGQCINTDGSFMCTCSDGLIAAVDNSSCIDINECLGNNTNICGNGNCVNNVGSYTCECEDGYSMKTTFAPICTDDDECLLETHACDRNALCINNPGSYSCRCYDGFIGNGLTCSDINECLTNNGRCDKNAQCINTDGSFKCICDEGFKGDGYYCDDADECATNPELCENGHCINYPGSYRCECEMGFMNPDDKNQQQCIDINECQLFNNLCIFGKCENALGMFRCQCNPGYQIDNTGGNCTDINECESPQACLYGNCTNTEGSFVCTCPPNFQLSSTGNACIDRRESRCYMQVEEKSGRKRCSQEIGSPVTKATCCCSVGRAWGGRCEICPAVDTDEYKHLCPGGTGFRPNTTTVVLEDVDECKEHENLCKNGHCTNTFGSYMCICNEGFRLDNTSAFCHDINECQEALNVCGVGFCINDEGSYHCICPDGYMVMPSGKECVDTRKEECYLNYTTGMCSLPMSNAQTRIICCCSMGQAWGYPCQPCPVISSLEYMELCGSRPGQVINPMTNQTEEIDECSLMPHICAQGTCINTPGSFHCMCSSGFVYDEPSHHCIDENECLNTPKPCDGIAQCLNIPGSFKCQCPEGYRFGPTLKQCIDINECEESDGICDKGECTNLEGSFQCVCRNGYILTPRRDSCIDIDECQRHPNICNNGTCVNSIGSFKCHCYSGFKLSHNNDCIDVDECTIMPHLCRNGRCKNTIGSFHCECVDGYKLAPDGQYCTDIDECKQNSSCPFPGICQNLMGSYLCICPSGYYLSPDKTTCLDFDECANTKGICEHGTCTNTQGAFNCTCPNGFVLSLDSTKCVDNRLDYCYDTYTRGSCTLERTLNLTMKECCCSMGAAWGRNCGRCPSPGSVEFIKLCPTGIGRGDEGEDLNECAIMPNICDGGECINTDGSFRCECPVGFVLDAFTSKCIDDNECLSNADICGNGTCVNIEGGYECSCSDGFSPGRTQTCEDVDECSEGKDQCAFRCHNVMGSYRCICPYGYSLASDGKHCQDVDECVTPANKCRFQCKNLIGSFMCICPDGYIQVGSGDDCQDVDECTEIADVCKNGRCVNLQGGYKCECLDGFNASADGRHCIDSRVGYCYRKLINGKCVDEVDNRAIGLSDCCCTMGAAWGPQCHLCPTENTNEYKQLCLASGYTVEGRDIDECQTMPGLCKHGRCLNTLGSYKCLCNKGYKVDHIGTHCNDINECALNPSPCQMSCENTDGGFICSCARGYVLNRDNTTCKDVDECATGKHICQQKCINTQGSYQCACNPGYNQIGDHCLDIDECDDPIVCAPPGNCINTLGSYRCLCPRGYKLSPSGAYCVDLKECPDGKCDQTHPCGKGPGKFNCSTSCPDGYVKHPYQEECIDRNECIQSPCGQTQCMNTLGSFQCVCPDGFQFDDASLSCSQLVGGCVGSHCGFGCTPLGMTGFTCGCPSGYQRIGQGHCLSSVNPLIGAQLPGTLNVGYSSFPVDNAVYSIPSDNIISSEGCFSCKVNGDKSKRQRRMINTRGNISIPAEKFEKFPNRKILKQNKDDVIVDNLRHHHGDKKHPHMNLVIKSDQTRSTAQILKIQPAVTDPIKYFLSDSEDSKYFGMVKVGSVWMLYFQQEIKDARVFHIGIFSKVETGTKNESSPIPLLSLHLKIIVVP